MNFKINNKTGSPVKYEKEVHSLCDFAQQRLGFEKPPSIFLNHDERNAGNTLGKTGHYDPNTMEIHVFATGRHPKDILRSIAHELVHHNQNMNGELDHSGYTGKGYAQKNPKLRQSELEANDPMLFRDWEDSLKEKENTIYNERRIRKMSLKEWKNKEIGGLLTDKWGFKMDLGKLNEGEVPEQLKPFVKKKKGDDAEDEDEKESDEDKGPEKEDKPDKDHGRDKFRKDDKEKSKDDEEKEDLKECGEPMVEPMAPEMPAEDCMDINGKKYCAEPAVAVNAIMENEEEIVNEVMKRLMKYMKKGKK